MFIESTPAIQDYIKTIYFLSEGGNPATTNRIAERLGTSSPAVTKMLKILAARGWVRYRRYYGVYLTEEGKAMALEVVRHHRLLERYLVEHLGFGAHEVHEQAEILEHHITEEFEDRIAELMGDPDTCPHGKPIPPKQVREVLPR